jgi:hypothetical protein
MPVHAGDPSEGLPIRLTRAVVGRLGRVTLVRRYAAALSGASVAHHAVVLGAGMWIAALVTLATPGAFDRHGILKGVDFLQFFTAGRMVADGRVDQLYDWEAFASTLRSAVPGTGELLFLSVYPPQVALAFAPLGRMDYLGALAIWTAISALLYGVSVRALQRASPFFQDQRKTWWLVAVAFAPFQQVILHGQVAVPALVCFTAAWLALRRNRRWWFGAALGCLAFKPQFGVAAAIAILITRDYRVAVGAAGAALVQIVLAAAALGPDVVIDYALKIPLVLRSPELFEPKLWQMHNLRGFWGLLLGTGTIGRVITLGSSVVVVYFVFRIWRATTAAGLRIAALVLGTVLVNPHLYVYDLVVLAVPLALIVAFTAEHGPRDDTGLLAVLVHLLCWVPLLSPLAALTHLQLTTPCLVVLLVVLSESALGRPTAARAATA